MSTTALPTSQDARHGLGRQLRLYASTFARNKSAMLGLVIVVGFLLVALFAPWLAPYPERRRQHQAGAEAASAQFGALVRHRRDGQRCVLARDPGRAHLVTKSA